MQLIYFMWTVKDFQQMEALNLTMEQRGILFSAVMQYVKDATVMDVPDILKWPFAAMRAKVDAARLKCASRTQPREKADPTETVPVQQKPLTRSRIGDILFNMKEAGEIEITDAQLSIFKSEMRASQYKIGPLSLKADEETLRQILLYRFPVPAIKDARLRTARWTALCYFILSGAHLNEALDLGRRFTECYAREKGWRVGDSLYDNAFQAAQIFYETAAKE